MARRAEPPVSFMAGGFCRAPPYLRSRGGAPLKKDERLFARHNTVQPFVCIDIRRIVKPSATPCQNVLHKAFSTANTCASGCSISTRISQCIHQNIGQYPDASGKILVANRWCFRLSHAARAGTAAESKILHPALLLLPRAARTLCPCPA